MPNVAEVLKSIGVLCLHLAETAAADPRLQEAVLTVVAGALTAAAAKKS